MRALLHATVAVAMAATGGAIAWESGSAPLEAADHFDPPARVDPAINTTNPDIAADIADLYLYHTATSLIVSVDFAGPRPTSEPARYNRNVLYQISLSNAGSQTDAEFTIDIRFGQDPANPAASGVRIAGIPGESAPVITPVETIFTTAAGTKVFAGLIDDPFNFDAVGLRLTRESGTLMFNNTRNRFANQNTTAVIIEIPLAAIRNGTNPITAWSAASRIPGSAL